MSSPFARLLEIDTADAGAVAAGIDAMLGEHYGRRWNGAFVQGAFEETAARYAGALHGTLACDTPYHDLQHVLSAALACARLVDGWERTRARGHRLGPEAAMTAVLLALLHDVGFLRRSDEAHVNGAVLTAQHEARSAAAAETYLRHSPLAAHAGLARLIGATRLGSPLHAVGAERDIVVAQMLVVSDLVSQLADRCYLEKCRDFLFAEFVEAGLARGPEGRNPQAPYASAEDLLRKTPGFCRTHVLARLEGELGEVHALFAVHFGVDPGSDPYSEAMRLNLAHLQRVLDSGEFAMLRRRAVAVYGERTPPRRKVSGAD